MLFPAADIDFLAVSFDTAELTAARSNASFNISVLQDDITEWTEAFSASLVQVVSMSEASSAIFLNATETSRIILNPATTTFRIFDDDGMYRSL